MFKDLYNSANDKIPTEDAYLRVMKKVESGPRKNKYGYVKVAALAACFLLTVSTISVYEKHSSKKTGSLDIVVSTEYTQPTETSEPIVIPKSLTPEQEDNNEPQVESVIIPVIETPAPTVKPSKKTQTVPSTKPTQIQDKKSTPISVVKPEELTVETTNITETPKNEITEKEVSTEIPTEIPSVQESPVIDTPQNTIVETSTNNIVKNQGIPEDIGISLAKYALDGDVVTKEDYSIYIGKNIEENVVLPDSFKNETSDDHILHLEDDENFNDEWTYYFTSDESSVFINTTKKTEKIKAVIENEAYTKSNISECEAVVFEEDVQKTALFVNEEIGYSVTGINVSDEVFEDLVSSLVK